MDAAELVAWNLRRWRVARGVSQEQLAVDANVDRSYVGRLERAIENPTILLLEKLSRALSIEIQELLRTPRRGEAPPRTLSRGRKKRA